MGFILSKAIWFVAQPSSLLLFLALIGLMLAAGRWRARWGLRLATLSVGALLVLGLSPVAHWLTLPLEDRFALPDLAALPKPDAIIVLGGMLDTVVTVARHADTMNEAGERVTATIVLARLFPTTRVIFSGGAAEIIYASMSEAEAARRILLGLGLAPARLLLEDKSRTTAENASMTRELLLREGFPPGGRYLLVTSAHHMPRAVACFRKAGLAVIPYPVDFRTRGPSDLWRFFERPSEGLRRADLVVKEWAGLFTYWLRGDTSELWPAP